MTLLFAQGDTLVDTAFEDDTICALCPSSIQPQIIIIFRNAVEFSKTFQGMM